VCLWDVSADHLSSWGDCPSAVVQWKLTYSLNISVYWAVGIGTVLTTLHCNLPGCWFKSNICLCLWDLFPLTDVPQPYVTDVTRAEAKQLNWIHLCPHLLLCEDYFLTGFELVRMFLHVHSFIWRAPPSLVGSALDHRSLPPEFNLDVGMSEGCFIFDFTSLPLEVTRLFSLTMCTKVVVKHQSSSSFIWSSHTNHYNYCIVNSFPT